MTKAKLIIDMPESCINDSTGVCCDWMHSCEVFDNHETTGTSPNAACLGRLDGCPLQEVKTCKWSKQVDGNRYWNTGCGRAFIFFSEDCKTYRFKYCPYCGLEISCGDRKRN